MILVNPCPPIDWLLLKRRKKTDNINTSVFHPRRCVWNHECTIKRHAVIYRLTNTSFYRSNKRSFSLWQIKLMNHKPESICTSEKFVTDVFIFQIINDNIIVFLVALKNLERALGMLKKTFKTFTRRYIVCLMYIMIGILFRFE